MFPRGSTLLIAGVLFAVLVPAGIDLGGAMNGSDSTPASGAAVDAEAQPADAAEPPASEPTQFTPTPTAAPQGRATGDARLEPAALSRITLSHSVRSP